MFVLSQIIINILFFSKQKSVFFLDNNNFSLHYLNLILFSPFLTLNPEAKINTVILTVFAEDSDTSKELRYSVVLNSITARNGAGSLLIPTDSFNYRVGIIISIRNS